MTIFKNADRFKRITENLISESPVTVNVKEYTGYTACSNCSYDTQTRASSIPNCPICKGKGRLQVYTTHNENVVALWITSDNLLQQEVGDLSIGDCKLTARYSTLSWFQNCNTHKTTISVDSTDVIVKRIIPGLFKEKVTVYCSKTQL